MFDVSVVILTFRRPQLLEKTISSVAWQNNALGLRYEIIVVDNSPEKSAEDTVRRMIATHDVPIRYVSEPRQNIALARNAGIDHSKAEFVAMIDDDEQAARDWLHHLVTTVRKYDADVVMGPTTPIFEKEVPAWFGQNCDIFDRSRNILTGTRIDLGPSANFLMKSATCVAKNNRFDPELGKRMGRKIVWCNEAKVEEFIPESRLTVRYLMRRHLRVNQAFVWGSVRHSDHPIRTAAYWMLVVGCTQIVIWIIPSLVLAPFRTAHSVRARANLMRGVGKLFWGKKFRFNFY